MVKKKLLSATLVAVTVCSMIFTGCGSSAENTGNDREMIQERQIPAHRQEILRMM